MKKSVAIIFDFHQYFVRIEFLYVIACLCVAGNLSSLESTITKTIVSHLFSLASCAYLVWDFVKLSMSF